MQTSRGFSEIAIKILLLAGVLTIGALSGFAKDKYETIDAHAFGTGTQMGSEYRSNLEYL